MRVIVREHLAPTFVGQALDAQAPLAKRRPSRETGGASAHANETEDIGVVGNDCLVAAAGKALNQVQVRTKHAFGRGERMAGALLRDDDVDAIDAISARYLIDHGV